MTFTADKNLDRDVDKQVYVAAALPRFELGQVVATPGALQLLQDSCVDPLSLVQKHASGCWGTISQRDAKANEDALLLGDRLLSSYLLPNGGVIWIETSSDRSVTTVLRPDEW